MQPAAASMSALFDFLKTVDTPTLSNAIEEFGVRPRHEGFASSDIRCMFPEFGVMCGWAVTAQVETVTESWPEDRDTFPALFRAIAASAKPVIVTFQEIGGRREHAAHCGEVMSTVFQRLGAVGLVTDAAVRDFAQVRALGFHYFARGCVASHANFRIVRVGIPIHLSGMTVRPGILLHGDENGVITVPNAILDRLPAAVERVRAEEASLFDHVRGPDFNVDHLIRRFYH